MKHKIGSKGCVTPPKGSENRKTSESINTKSVCSLHNLFQYKQTSNSSWLCINDNLPEMSHYGPDSGSGASGR